MKNNKKLRAIYVLSVFVILFPLILHAHDTVSGAFGTNLHLVARYYEEDWDTVLTKAQTNGVEWAREEFSWQTIEPVNDNYNFANYDAAIEKYNTAGVEVLGLITYSTEWASSNPGSADYEYYAPDMDAWEDYVTELVTRYEGQVAAWEIWNEPNSDQFWKSSEEDYITLLETASDVIRENDSDAIIVLGGTAGTDTDFVDSIYSQVENKSVFDVVAVHPYRQANSSYNYMPEESIEGLNQLQTDLENLRAVMRKNGDAGKPVWLTEFGWTSYDDGVSEDEQADYLMRGYAIALSVANVQKVFWYTFRDDSESTEYLESSFGMVNRDFEDKEAISHYNFLKSKLTERKFSSNSLVNPFLIDNFNRKNGWKFYGVVGTDGHLDENHHGKLKISYKFNDSSNSYLPITREFKLKNYTNAISFRVKGSDDSTILRIRIKDRSGEIFQYNLGYLPSTMTTMRINFKDYHDYWGGDEDGIMDAPLYFDSFILDDNPDGSLAEGTVYFDDLVSSTKGNAYLYKYTEGDNTYYLVWTRAKARNYKIYLEEVDQIIERTIDSNTRINGNNNYFSLYLSNQPKWLQVRS